MDAFYRDVSDKSRARLNTEFKDFQRLYAKELEEYLVSKALAKGGGWSRDYSSEDAYLKSVAGHREQWRDVLGRFEADAVDGEPTSWLLHDDEVHEAHWVRVEILPGVLSRFIVAKPKGVERPLRVVICQHGVSSSPFKVMGYDDPDGAYSDLVSLICPRPLQVHHGKADGIAWWPLVEEEWAVAYAHYEKLGIADRAEMVMHDSGHEILPSKTVPFFEKWL